MGRHLAQDVFIDRDGFREPAVVLELGRLAQAGEVGVLGRRACQGGEQGSGPSNHGAAALLPLPRAAAVRGAAAPPVGAAPRGVWLPERVARKHRASVM